MGVPLRASHLTQEPPRGGGFSSAAAIFIFTSPLKRSDDCLEAPRCAGPA